MSSLNRIYSSMAKCFSWTIRSCILYGFWISARRLLEHLHHFKVDVIKTVTIPLMKKFLLDDEELDLKVTTNKINADKWARTNYKHYKVHICDN